MKLFKLNIFFLILYFNNLSASSSFFDINFLGSSISITSNVPDFTYVKAGVKINNGDYQLAQVGTECQLASSGYCIFQISDTAPVTISLNGTGEILDVTACLNGVTVSSCQNFNISTSSALNNKIYISHRQDDVVRACDMQDFALINCADAVNINEPTNIAFNTSKNKVYIATNGGSTIGLCDVTASGFTNCSTTGSLAGYLLPYDIAVTSDNAYAFVTIEDTSTFDRVLNMCTIGQSWDLTCNSTSAYSFQNATDVVYDLTGNNLYVTDSFTGGDVIKCSINAGVLSCASAGAAFTRPSALAINHAHDTLFVVDANTTIQSCTILAGGNLGSCASFGLGYNASSLAVNLDDSKIYIGHANDTNISICPLAGGTIVNSCVDSNDGSATAPYGLTIF